MPNILIRNVPKETVDALKKLAARHGRSLQQELSLELERLANTSSFDYVEYAEQIRKRIAKRTRGRPLSDSTEIIRWDRDHEH